MDISHITSESLKHLLDLTERKNDLIKAVEDIENQIASTLKGTAKTVSSTVSNTVAIVTAAPKKVARKAVSKKKTVRSGALKEQILDLLDAAGAQGLKVKEIAQELGKPVGNISVWFSTTGKKLASKIEPGRYAAKGASKAAPVKVAAVKVAAVASPVVAAKPAKKGKGKRKMSAADKAKISEAMKAKWAERKAGKSAPKGKKAAKKSNAPF